MGALLTVWALEGGAGGRRNIGVGVREGEDGGVWLEKREDIGDR